MNVFDFDGVCTIGLLPRLGDIIVTGRGFDELLEVRGFLVKAIGASAYTIPVYFNPITKAMGRTREDSGNHKARTILTFLLAGMIPEHIFEDDPIQFNIIEEAISKYYDGSTSPDPRPRVVKIECPWVQK